MMASLVLAFGEHRRTIEDRFAQCERLESALREAVTEWCLYPVIEALQAMRSIPGISDNLLLSAFSRCQSILVALRKNFLP